MFGSPKRGYHLSTEVCTVVSLWAKLTSWN